MQKTIRNETPQTLELTGAEGRQLILAPLETRQFSGEDVMGFDLTEARRAGLVTDWTEPPSDTVETMVGLLFAMGVAVAIICGVVSGSEQPSWVKTKANWQAGVWITGAALLVIGLGVAAIYKTKSLRLVARFVAQIFSLLFILAIGLGLPATTVYFFGEGKALLTEPSPKLFARLLQVAFIATASLLPVLLYFLFDRFQLNTLRNRLYRDLFRLDRNLQTRSEIDAKYGSQIREAYGPEDQGRGRLAPGTRWPVLVCAFVVTMGWLAAFRLVGSADEAVKEPLVPERSAFAFGFLGAYFFGLLLVARRYARGDLKPKAYAYIAIRILIVAVMSWILDLIFSQDSSIKLVTAFLIGIVPEEFFTLLKEQLRGRGPDRLVPESEKHPLTKLEGIDLYDRARLEQEGIVNVESYAHYDLIHLVLETQIPVPRLVDWMDQAILYLHIIEEPTQEKSERKVMTREQLRQYGIRTTTDLLTCWKAAEDRQKAAEKQPGNADGGKELEEFKKLLGESKPYRLEIIRDALLDDEWLERVRDWRNDAEREPLEVEVGPRSFEGKLAWAETLEAERRYEAALQTYLEAIELFDDAQARIRLSRLFATVPVASLRDIERSQEHIRRAFELCQDDAYLLVEVIEINETNGDIDDALRACERAIEVIGDPGNNKEKQRLLETLKRTRTNLEKKKAA